MRVFTGMKQRLPFFSGLLALLPCAGGAAAQDTARWAFSSSTGVLLPLGAFSGAYRPSFAFGSGLEWRPTRRWVLQGSLAFNPVGYDQQVADGGSPQLVRGASSSLLLLGAGAALRLPLGRNPRLSWQPFVQGGWIRIGEPRLFAVAGTNLQEQRAYVHHEAYGKGGLRFSLATRSSFFGTLYFETDYWTATGRVQNAQPQAVEAGVGTCIPL